MPKNEITPDAHEVDLLLSQIQRRNISAGNIALREMTMAKTNKARKLFIADLRDLANSAKQVVHYLGDSQKGLVVKAQAHEDLIAAEAKDCCLIMSDYTTLAHLPINYEDFARNPGKLNNRLIEMRAEEIVYFFPGTAWEQPHVSHINQWFKNNLAKSEFSAEVGWPEDYRLWLHSTPGGSRMYIHERISDSVKMIGGSTNFLLHRRQNRRPMSPR